MKIIKSTGTTKTEKLLSKLCNDSFLELWSYPNPFNSKKKELCDLLAVFENHVFIFFDRENLQLDNRDKDPEINWKRWKRKVIEPQIRTANGVERYIKNNGKIYLDKDLKQQFPIPINPETMVVHKIIIAHGAKEACLQSSKNNIYGSLAINYSSTDIDFLQFPYHVHLDKNCPVHLFDSHNLPIILGELDTFFDFSTYLNAKVEAIKKYDYLSYCGEEDLLVNYFSNFNKETNRHFIGVKDINVNGLHIGEGDWKDFVDSELYKSKKDADEISYTWDRLIQKTCRNALNGVLGGNANLFSGQSAILEMAKEPRFMRRYLSQKIIDAINKFPENQAKFMKQLTFLYSFYENKAYVILQLKVFKINDYKNEYRPKRQRMLEIACGAAKNKFPNLNKIIGIAFDAMKFTDYNSEDFILLNCSEWSNEEKQYYEKCNKSMNFFKTGKIHKEQNNPTEFPRP
ncbi:MAG: hypothetical protein H8E22_00525 [Candidatus Cloacimonetes bacterium]|nr:hypothetical protein [Candidatus Cloacimonadota bacterium]